MKGHVCTKMPPACDENKFIPGGTKLLTKTNIPVTNIGFSVVV